MKWLNPLYTFCRFLAWINSVIDRAIEDARQ